MKKLFLISATALLTACGGGSDGGDDGNSGSKKAAISYDARDYVQGAKVNDDDLSGTWLFTSSIEYEIDKGGIATVYSLDRERSIYKISKNTDDTYTVYTCRRSTTLPIDVDAKVNENNIFSFNDSYNNVSYNFDIESNTELTVTDDTLENLGGGSFTVTSAQANAVKIKSSSSPLAAVGNTNFKNFTTLPDAPNELEVNYSLLCFWEYQKSKTAEILDSAENIDKKNYVSFDNVMEFVVKNTIEQVYFYIKDEKKNAQISSSVKTDFGTSNSFLFDKDKVDSKRLFNYAQKSYSIDATYKVGNTDYENRFVIKNNLNF